MCFGQPCWEALFWSESWEIELCKNKECTNKTGTLHHCKVSCKQWATVANFGRFHAGVSYWPSGCQLLVIMARLPSKQLAESRAYVTYDRKLCLHDWVQALGDWQVCLAPEGGAKPKKTQKSIAHIWTKRCSNRIVCIRVVFLTGKTQFKPVPCWQPHLTMLYWSRAVHSSSWSHKAILQLFGPLSGPQVSMVKLRRKMPVLLWESKIRGPRFSLASH